MIVNNGGNPIHFEFYDGYDVRTPPQGWEPAVDPVVFKLARDSQKAMFETETGGKEMGSTTRAQDAST